MLTLRFLLRFASIDLCDAMLPSYWPISKKKGGVSYSVVKRYLLQNATY